MNERKKVLVTGISGFLASHTAIQLLEKGYQVVGTLRDIKRSESIQNVIRKHTTQVEHLSFVEADLMNEANWHQAMQAIDYVMHIASPFPRELPKNDDELILPAQKGTLSVLKAASQNQVKRVVLTSSSGAIAYGKERAKRSGIFTENDWTDTENKKDTTPYFRSKTLAEKAAWEFIQNQKNGLELTVICPGAILGPVLEQDFGTSANIVIKTLDGSSPAIPNIGFDLVDVRSVAEMHIKAMETPEASGERFICSAGYLSFKEVAQTLKAKYPQKRIPSVSLPDFAVRLFALFEKTLQPILLDLSVARKLDNSKAKKILNWQPIAPQEAVLACAESLFQLGILKQ